jgi:hypothetical protein
MADRDHDLVWAGRLGSFLFRRIHAAGGDQRFDHIKVSSSRFFVAWTLQGAWVVMTSCAALTAILSTEQTALGAVYVIGAVMWVLASRSKSSQIGKSRVQGRSGQCGAFHQYRIVGPLPPPQLLW